MEITNEQIYERIGVVEDLVRASVRAGKSDKLRELEIEVKTRSCMKVSEVQTYFGGISRPWALKLMKELGKEPFFKFLLGDKEQKRPSSILHNRQESKKETLEKMSKALIASKQLSLSELADLLNLKKYEYWLQIIRGYVSDLIESDERFTQDEGKVYFNEH